MCIRDRNKAIIDNKVLETKAEQEAKFAAFAKAKGNTDYEKVVSEIDAAIEKLSLIHILWRNNRCERLLSDAGSNRRSCTLP